MKGNSVAGRRSLGLQSQPQLASGLEAAIDFAGGTRVI